MAESASSISLSGEEEEEEEEGENQGTHELELHYGEELDLHQHVRCEKNPGHIDFIPVTSSNLNHSFNFDYWDTVSLNRFCFQAAKLTTKIKVQRVSPNRSKVKRGNRSIVLSRLAGQRIPTCGSGCVTDIDVSGDEGSFPCPLENCPHSTEPHQVYGYIIITTAAHVIFDDNEAKETIVEFFDDDPKDKRNVEIANGVKIRHCSVEGDFCELMCVTHSLSLFGEISQKIEKQSGQPLMYNAEELHRIKFIERLQQIILNASTEVPLQQSGDSLVIHFSHPHGQSKQVTFGEHFSCDTGTGHYEHIYTVPTCHGCSGGPVWIFPKGEDGKILWDQVYGVPHGGCYDRRNKLNHSSSWTFIPHFLKTVEYNTAEQELILGVESAGEMKDETRNSKASSSPSVLLSPQSGSADTIHPNNGNLKPEEKKRWLNYLLNTSVDKLPPGVSKAHAIGLKQREGTHYRICDDDDVEALLSLASQCEL